MPPRSGPRCIVLSNKKLGSLLTNQWPAGEKKKVHYFDSFIAETSLFTHPTDRLLPLLDTLKCAPPFSIGVVYDTSQTLRFVVLGSAAGFVVLDANIDLSSFWDQLRAFNFHGVGIVQHSAALHSYLKFAVNTVDVDASPGFAAMVNSAKGNAANFQLLESHVISDTSRDLTVRDVLAAVLPTVYAQFYIGRTASRAIARPRSPVVVPLSPDLIVAAPATALPSDRPEILMVPKPTPEQYWKSLGDPPESDASPSRSKKRITPPERDPGEVLPPFEPARFVARPPPLATPPTPPPASPELMESDSDDEGDTPFTLPLTLIRRDSVQAEKPESGSLDPAIVKAKSHDGLPEFWEELDMLELVLSGTNRIGFDGPFPHCKICQKKFASAAKLMHHCWAQHREALNEFSFA
jgi:hypothetical protein